MTALAERLKSAGADTIGAQLTSACTEALRRHPGSVVDAWRHVGIIFGHEFVCALMEDMQGPAKPAGPTPSSAVKHTEVAAYKPRVIPPERLEKRREIAQVIRSKYLHSGGGAWSDVGWHELQGMKRDGNEAVALLAAGPANIPNDGRTVGDVLGVKMIDQIISGVRTS